MDELSDRPALTIPTPVKAFPPGRRGVFLPVGDRRTAALAVTLLTTSKPIPQAVQQVAYVVARFAGTAALPWKTEQWTPGIENDTFTEVSRIWTQHIGPFDGIAPYQRRQEGRGGLTAILTRQGQPLALAKLRTDGTSLVHEQVALRAVAEFGPRTFSAPRPIAFGSVEGLPWSLQSVVFTRPHKPAYDVPEELWSEVAASLASASHGSLTPTHGDLTPWNLRRDHRGQLWLYDWEDWGSAPTGSDRAYFEACRFALTGKPLSHRPGPAAIAY